MKRLANKMVKGLIGLGCVASLCVTLHGISNINDGKVQAEPKVQAVQEVSKNDGKNTIDSNKGIMVKAENWLNEEDDENKDLDGNVIIEDGNKIIEISKETYDEIEHGENSDLTGDVYLGKDDIISVGYKNSTSDDGMYHQIKSVEELKDYFNKFNVVDSNVSHTDDSDYFTITLNNGITITYEYYSDLFYVNDGKNVEDFESIENVAKYVNKTLRSKYEDYKNSLISQYGEDTYKLMNQEEGIENEEQSFQHYVEYGI